jgi:hypothetical protein
MKCSDSPSPIPVERRGDRPAARAALEIEKARNAEELSEVETVVSRAALLMRRGLKKAA